MVQTEDQFAYIHYALLEYIKSGDTEIEAHELRDYIRRKTEVDTVTGLFIKDRYSKSPHTRTYFFRERLK